MGAWLPSQPEAYAWKLPEQLLVAYSVSVQLLRMTLWMAASPVPDVSSGHHACWLAGPM